MNDTTGNSANHDVTVTVIDTATPNIPTPPSDLEYKLSVVGNEISWTWNESHPHMYNITWVEQGTLNQSGAYQNDTAITFDIDGLYVGIYTFRIGVNDTTGNSATDDVIVTVVLDNIYPTINLTSPQLNGTVQVGNSYTIEGFANGTETVISAVTINDSRFILSLDPSGNVTGNFAFVNGSFISDGLITVKITVNDTADLKTNITLTFRVLRNSNNTRQEIYSDRENIIHGTDSLGNYTVQLKIFVSSDTNVTITYFTENPTSSSLNNFISGFEFTIDNDTALINVTIIIYYDDTGLTIQQELNIRLYYLNGTTWQELDAIIDTVNNSLTWSATSFSYYAIAQKSVGSPSPPPPDNLFLIIILLIIILAAGISIPAVFLVRKKKANRKRREKLDAELPVPKVTVEKRPAKPKKDQPFDKKIDSLEKSIEKKLAKPIKPKVSPTIRRVAPSPKKAKQVTKTKLNIPPPKPVPKTTKIGTSAKPRNVVRTTISRPPKVKKIGEIKKKDALLETKEKIKQDLSKENKKVEESKSNVQKGISEKPKKKKK